ncbi:methanol/ethanol family PQQ-dependent dehydrogenase [Methylobacillus sp.]|uniref:methanol/ethanol family PQQ-dependent dehydrogenase n=1 Tax=Methylobacillus sp. TaxID=56818 RepID=UPI0012CBC981|nr:methanol/ethanol family PQQ-dependent dehydrogenase [Methylobacillus sp.]MPS48785.1 PQQ-dependent dehydrogenase, methanol/ethanol family [Methylobacillus sp.]
MRISPFLIVVSLNLVSAVSSAADPLLPLLQDDKQWVSPRKDYYNQGYSRLSQINHRNVANLKLAWSFSTGVQRGHEGAPLVVGNVMYVHTAFPNNVYALDLDHDQKILWAYFPKQTSDIEAILCCDSVSRGLAYGDGKILLQQNNGILLALDARDGRKVWEVQVNDPRMGATNTNAPYVFRDKVLTGCSGGEFGVRCFLAAYALQDGRLQWKAYSTGPDSEVLIGPGFNAENPHYSALSTYEDVNGGNREGGSFRALPKERLKFPETELGVKTWLKPQAAANGWQHGGGPVWGWFSYDPKLNLVYYGTGNPSVWNPDIRPGDNKWAMTLFARDLDTGMARWGYQLTPHDEWDYDSVNELILWDQGRRKLATHFDRNGFAYTLDRQNGKLLAAEKMHPFVNWATGIDLQTGIPLKDGRYATHEDQETAAICPSAIGVKNIQPAAYSPQNGWFYVPMNHLCMTYEAVEAKYVAGQPWAGASLSMHPGPDGDMGAFMAWDALKHKPVWYTREKYPVWSGALATAGQLAFYGTLDRWFKALDARNGKELWRFQVGSGIVGNPMTYQHAGKQYVAVFSGIGGWAGVALNQGLTGDSDGAGTAGAFRGLNQENAAPGSGALNVFAL